MAEMLKRKDFLENEVVDLREEIALTSPTDTPLTTLLMGRAVSVWNTLNDPTTKGLGDSERAKSYTDPQ